MAQLVAALDDDRDSVTAFERSVGISSREARRRRDIATIVHAVPEAQALLESGAVSVQHIAALRPVIALPSVGELALTAFGTSPEASAQQVQQFRLASEHGDDTAARQYSMRRLRLYDGPEGMVSLSGFLPPQEGAALKTMVGTLVDTRWKAEHPERARELGKHGGDDREQRAADALLELTRVTRAASGEPNATRVATSKPTTVVVFDVETYEAEMLDPRTGARYVFVVR